jgi:hypothetical protein
VEVLRRYSRQQAVADRLCKALEYALTVSFEAAPPPARPVPKIHKLSQRLSLETVVALIADYEAGLKGKALAEKYGIQKNSVLGLLKQHGVARDRTVVSDEQAAAAVALLTAGVALKRAAEQLGIAPTTLGRALRARGLPTRKTWA